MSTTGTVDYSVAQIVQADHEIQGHIKSLIPYINIDSIPAGKGWSKMEYEYGDSKILDKIREEFKKQFNRSQEITDIVDTLISSPKPSKKQYFTSPDRTISGISERMVISGE